MNRRQFLQRATLAAAALTVDPEQLLWTPGTKTLFLPPERRVVSLEEGLWAMVPYGNARLDDARSDFMRMHVRVSSLDQLQREMTEVTAMGGYLLEPQWRTVRGWR